MMVIYAMIFFVAVLIPMGWWNIRNERIEKEDRRINKRTKTVFGLSIQNDNHDFENL